MASEDINLKINSHLGIALENFLVQDYNEAIRQLKAAEVLDRNNPEILYNLGINYARLGLSKTAISYFRRILELPVTFVEMQEIRKITAYLSIHLEDYDEAEDILNRAIRQHPSDTAAHNMKGYCLEKKGNMNEAILAYETALDLDRENSTACNSLAYLLALKGEKTDQALSLARRACKASPDNPAYCDTLGYILMQKKDYKNAARFLKKAARLAPLSEEIKDHLTELKKRSPHHKK